MGRAWGVRHICSRPRQLTQREPSAAVLSVEGLGGQGLVEIVEQVGLRFDAYREADQAVVDP